jgi:hypothetical protein
MRQLNDLAKRILDENRPEMTRALDLYELQVGIFIPSQVKPARMYWGMMLLDHLGDAHGFRTGDLASASVVVEYRELFDDIIGERGWAGLCRLNSAQKFDKKLQQSILKSQSIAKAVESLCRSAEDGAEQPSLAFAEYAIRWWSEEMEVTPRQSPQHIAKNNEALLIHLLLEHFPDLLPSALKNSRFTRQLVSQVRDTKSLRRFFSGYNRVLALLSPVTREFGRPLMMDGREVADGIVWKPIDTQMKRLIEDYRKERRDQRRLR